MQSNPDNVTDMENIVSEDSREQDTSDIFMSKLEQREHLDDALMSRMRLTNLQNDRDTEIGGSILLASREPLPVTI
jgi:hypothetical protein